MLAGVAQEAEQLICNQPVKGSTPFASPGFRISSGVLVPGSRGTPFPEARRDGAFAEARRGALRREPEGRRRRCCAEGSGPVRRFRVGPPFALDADHPDPPTLPAEDESGCCPRNNAPEASSARGVVAKRPNAAGCKPAGFTPSEVRILPAPPPAPVSGSRPRTPTHRSRALPPTPAPLTNPLPDLLPRLSFPDFPSPTSFTAVPPRSAPRFRPFRRRSRLPLFRPPAGVAQLAERQPSKLRVAGSNPVSRSTGRTGSPGSGGLHSSTRSGPRFRFRPRGSVAEHFLGKEGVIGSIPIVGSTPVSRPVPRVASDFRATAAGNP